MSDKHPDKTRIFLKGVPMSSDSAISGVSGMSGTPSFNETNVSKQLFGAQVVKTTLDYMNPGSSGGSKGNADYDFQTKVLEAGMMAKGLGYMGKV